VAAIAAKDLLALRRDFRRLAGTLPALAMAVVWTFVNANHVPAGFWGVALPVSFVPGVVSLALALPAVAGEGRGMQLLVLAGLPMRTFLLAKLLSVLPVILPLTLATATVLLVVNHLGPAESVQVILLAAWFGCGMPAITVAAGALGPNFAASDPRRGVNPGWVMGAIAMVAVFAVLSFGGLLALQLAASGELPLLLAPFGVLLLAGSAAIVGGMLVTALRYLERWRPGE
jgi:hypothetical protein